MSEPRPCLLLFGLLGPDEDTLARAEDALLAEFGPVSARSATIPFDFTDYYSAEMGPGLVRRWTAHGPADPAGLAGLKRRAGRVEDRFRSAGRRAVNLDPGLLSPHNVVLASTKDFAHRIYISDGIFAEVALVFRDGRWAPLEWTYPDWRCAACLDFLSACRRRLLTARPGAG